MQMMCRQHVKTAFLQTYSDLKPNQCPEVNKRGNWVILSEKTRLVCSGVQLVGLVFLNNKTTHEACIIFFHWHEH